MELSDLDFFLVGAARSGTTSMWHALARTPGVFMPKELVHKEPGYFSELTGMSDRERYLELFAGADPAREVVGEASTAYLTDPAAAPRIAREVPDARIVILLRNPVDRAYSLYNWMAQEGYEPAPDFRRALALEEERAADPGFRRDNPQYYHNYLYVRSGRYAEQVERYLSRFGWARVRVLLFEDFVADPERAYREVLDLLGVTPPAGHRPDLRRRNPSRRPRSPALQVLLRRVTRTIRKLLPVRIGSKERRDLLLRAGLAPGSPDPLHGELRRELWERFRDDVGRLEEILGRELAGRWEGDA